MILCPTCADAVSKVLDSRKQPGGVYRRRECSQGHRFATTETVIRAIVSAPKSPSKPKRPKDRDLVLAAVKPAQVGAATRMFDANWRAAEIAKMFDLNIIDLRKAASVAPKG